jgi:hypothetical protein
MKGIIFCMILLFVSGTTLAKDSPVYDKGVLLRMESTKCGTAEKGGKTIPGEILGTDAENKDSKEVLCQEYLLQASRVVYRIRPRDDKHPVLLPVGETAEFRIDKDKMKLRVPETGDKEREYTVLSITPREDSTDQKSASKTATP